MRARGLGVEAALEERLQGGESDRGISASRPRPRALGCTLAAVATRALNSGQTCAFEFVCVSVCLCVCVCM